MKWNDQENAWHNTTKLSLSSILLEDINAKVDGFLEFKKDDTGGDVMNLFIEAAPGSWYYFNFQETSQIHHLGVLPRALPILDNTINGISITQE